jgi:hypothetical protein
MSAKVFQAIATQFRDRYLHPLQFNGSHRSVEDRVSDLERGAGGAQRLHTQPQPGTDAHFDHVMARSADALKRTSYAAGNVEEAAHAQRMKRSGDILQNIRNTAAEHREWSPLPEEKHADNMSRSGELLNRIRESQAKIGPLPDRPAPQPTAAPQRTQQLDLFPKAKVASPQQFGLAATEGPRPKRNAPTQRAARKSPELALFSKAATRRANTPGYVADQPTAPKSAVQKKKPAAAPASRAAKAAKAQTDEQHVPDWLR